MNTLIKIAKKVFLSYLRNKNIRQDKQQEYAKFLSDSMDLFFDSKGFLKNNLIIYQINVDPSQYIKDINNTNETYDVDVILFYKDKVQKKDYLQPVMKFNYDTGMAEAISNSKNNHCIVIYGDSKNNYDVKYFKQSFIHEMMHILDYCADENEHLQQFYYGHPYKNVFDNNGIPYPGMYGQDDDIFQEQFAEYFTCNAQRREYIYDLSLTIQHYAEKSNYTEQEIINELKQCLNNKNKFMNFINGLHGLGINYASLALLYHLTFSKNKNGTKQTALNILNNFK